MDNFSFLFRRPKWDREKACKMEIPPSMVISWSQYDCMSSGRHLHIPWGKKREDVAAPVVAFYIFFPLKNGNRAGAIQLISVPNDRSSGHL